MKDQFFERQKKAENIRELLKLMDECLFHAKQHRRTSCYSADRNEATAKIAVFNVVDRSRTMKYDVSFVLPGEQEIDKLHFDNLNDFARWLREVNYQQECAERKLQGKAPYKRDFV